MHDNAWTKTFTHQYSETAFNRADAETPWVVLAQACESIPIRADVRGGRSNRVWLEMDSKWWEPEN